MSQKNRTEKGFALGQQQKSINKEFQQQVGQNTEGISAEKEKFIHGMKTDSHKVLSPNKNE